MFIDKWELLRSYVKGASDISDGDVSESMDAILEEMERLDEIEKVDRKRLESLPDKVF